jgi:hypothetical protein
MLSPDRLQDFTKSEVLTAVVKKEIKSKPAPKPSKPNQIAKKSDTSVDTALSPKRPVLEASRQCLYCKSKI